MYHPQGLIIFGANGAGKTTLGRELGRVLNMRHMDIEDYHFEKSEIPYTVERTREECLDLMCSDIKKYGSYYFQIKRMKKYFRFALNAAQNGKHFFKVLNWK